MCIPWVTDVEAEVSREHRERAVRDTGSWREIKVIWRPRGFAALRHEAARFCLRTSDAQTTDAWERYRLLHSFRRNCKNRMRQRDRAAGAVRGSHAAGVRFMQREQRSSVR